ncbi:MAG: MarR family winged helix-turn-helix transcriptional regulator [Acidimicrobiales bacterium]
MKAPGSDAPDRDQSVSGDPAREAWERMRDLTHSPEVLGRAHEAAGEAGIIPGAAKALKYLSATVPTPMRQLAAQLRCDTSYITTIVDNLEEAGVARREAHATDRRIKVVVLTERGREVADRVAQIMGTPPPTFAALDAAETLALRDLLRKLDDGA